VRRRLEETGEATAFQIRHGRLPLAGLEELSPVLDELARQGGVGSPEQFRPIVRAARATQAVRRSLERAEGPHLADRRSRLPALDALLAEAAKLFGADGLLRDDASPELTAIRGRLRRRRGEVSRTLERLLDSRRDAFGDAVVVLRNDRYCLPVLASARGRVPGIVHDRSGSGQTVFVEPMEVIEPNNDLALLAAEERREIERLLRKFGDLVLSRAKLRQSRLIVQLVNLGEDPHDLALRRTATGARTYMTPKVSPGEDRSISFRLYPGRYALWCTIADHRARGMRATLIVTK